MHDHYLAELPTVWGFIRKEVKTDLPIEAKTRFDANLIEYGRWVAGGKRSALRLIGRSYAKFHEILSASLHICWKFHPKVCDTCNDHLQVEAELNGLLKQQKAEPTVDLRRQIDSKALEVNEYRIHAAQVKSQRASINTIRDNLGPTERLVVLDYVSSYGLTSRKFNFLVCLVFKREDGGLVHEFHDFFADPGVAHDAPFTRWAWETLLRGDVFKGVTKLYVSTDCGSPFKCYQVLFFFSTICPRFNIQVELHFFAPSHGYSLCDAHGGSLKRIFSKVQAQREEGFTKASELIQCVNDFKSENRFRNATFP